MKICDLKMPFQKLIFINTQDNKSDISCDTFFGYLNKYEKKNIYKYFFKLGWYVD